MRKLKIKLILCFLPVWICPAAFSVEMLIEAENFKNKGGWVVDQQFMDLMG